MIKHLSTFAVLCALLVAPVAVQAQSLTNNSTYNAMSVNEKIAYLYGMIAQLQIILELRLDAEGGSSSGSSGNARVEIKTLSASGIEEGEADLRAEVDLDGEDEARVWFEYGEDDDDLDERTNSRTVRDSSGDRQTIKINIDDLDEDERYYFRAVVQDEDGRRSYASVRNFRTDDDGNSSSSNSDDYELEISDTTVDEGDEVTVEWEIPDDETGTQNWIGLYEEGSSNQSFVRWVYIDNNDKGSEDFEMDEEGTFEFRLFLNNSYNAEITSDEVEVE